MANKKKILRRVLLIALVVGAAFWTWGYSDLLFLSLEAGSVCKTNELWHACDKQCLGNVTNKQAAERFTFDEQIEWQECKVACCKQKTEQPLPIADTEGGAIP